MNSLHSCNHARMCEKKQQTITAWKLALKYSLVFSANIVHTLDVFILTSLIQLLYFSVMAICSSCNKIEKQKSSVVWTHMRFMKEWIKKIYEKINYHRWSLIGFPIAWNWFAPTKEKSIKSLKKKEREKKEKM